MLIVDCQDLVKEMCCPVHSDQQGGPWDVESWRQCQNLMQLDSLNAGCRMHLKFILCLLSLYNCLAGHCFSGCHFLYCFNRNKM